MLIDALGALRSICLLAFVLVKLEWLRGIPKAALLFLFKIPVLFLLYDICCYCFLNKNHATHLKRITVANHVYFVISIAVAAYHRSVITMAGWIYIGFEIIVIPSLVGAELNVAKREIAKR